VVLRVLGRVAKAVITLVGVAVVVFIVLRLLPGNQITSSLGVNAGLLTKAQYTDLEHFYGIGKPLPQQFGQWAGDLLHGNMGVSEQSGRSVTSLIGAARPVTLELAVAAMLIGLVIGVGAVAAAAPGRLPGRGLSSRLVIVKHVLRNALIPIVTMSGIQFGYLLGGTVVVEQIFVLPGLGRLLLMSVTESDYAVAQGVTLVFALGFVTVNLLTDLLYAVVDPRLRS
jgi:ABC-type dipeptide/oligopeptide/nickel transport system permease component